MTNQLKEYLTQETKVSGDDLESILACFKKEKVKKNHILFHPYKVCKRLYFVETGCLRVVSVRDDGQEWTREIALEHNFITIFPSFIGQTITESSLQAVETSAVHYISYDNFKKLCQAIPEWKELYVNILEQTYVNSIQRIEKLIALSGKDMYADFIKNHPGLMNRLPNKIIASYLGVSQETLSRLKAKS